MAEYTAEQLEAAQTASSKEELIEMASEAGVELTDEEAERFMALIAQNKAGAQSSEAPGEISVEELENVAGGYCKDYRGREIVASMTPCMHHYYKYTCMGFDFAHPFTDRPACKYFTQEKNLYYCNYNVSPH